MEVSFETTAEKSTSISSPGHSELADQISISISISISIIPYLHHRGAHTETKWEKLKKPEQHYKIDGSLGV